jgi:hypothetical protein
MSDAISEEIHTLMTIAGCSVNLRNMHLFGFLSNVCPAAGECDTCIA